jgi:hypothetical protein
MLAKILYMCTVTTFFRCPTTVHRYHEGMFLTVELVEAWPDSLYLHLPYTPVYKRHQMSVSRLFWLFLSNPLSLRTDFVAKPIIPTESSRQDESNGVRFTMGGGHGCLLESWWVEMGGAYTMWRLYIGVDGTWPVYSKITLATPFWTSSGRHFYCT